MPACEQRRVLAHGLIDQDLGLTERARNCLKRAGINSIGELVACSAKDLLSITNFGQTSLKDVNDRLDERGLSLRAED